MTAEETLANARVQSDPLPIRNLGFYIVSQPAEQRWPQLYLRRDGRWTLGIHSSDEEYFWPTEEEAATALSEARAKVTPPAPCSRCATMEREIAELREALNWQNMPNRREPVRGGYEFYINEEWTCLRDAAIGEDVGCVATLMKTRFDPDDERVRVRRVLDDDAILQELATLKSSANQEITGR